jgi:hypothetical protein
MIKALSTGCFREYSGREGVGHWRKLQNEEPLILCSDVQVREIEIGGARSMHGRYEKCMQHFGGQV